MSSSYILKAIILKFTCDGCYPDIAVIHKSDSASPPTKSQISKLADLFLTAMSGDHELEVYKSDTDHCLAG